MSIKNFILSYLLRKKKHNIDLFFGTHANEIQEKILKDLIKKGSYSIFGKKHYFNTIESYQDFTNQIPIRTYEDLFPYIQQIRQGKNNVLWPGKIKWFSKSSGTTNAKSKFIPISHEGLNKSYMKEGKDLLSIYCRNFPNTKLFTGKGVILAGSLKENLKHNFIDGDVSAILMKHLPYFMSLHNTPKLEITILKDWEIKLKKIAKTIKNENITSLTGVPSWVLLLIKEVLKISNAKNIKEIWPNLELYIHGGVNMLPYRNQFNKLMPTDLNYLQVYNASEGFFAMQDVPDSDDMLLMLDYGIFYEFIPLENTELDKNITTKKAIKLEEIKINVEYAMVISTNSGLWRYLIGDTIKFTCINPYRIKVIGRTKSFINAFGEELIIENTEEAIKKASSLTSSYVNDYTVSPIFLNKNIGVHEWLIEFNKPPNDIFKFQEILDEHIKTLNSDYKAKRYNDLILQKPRIRKLKIGTFYNWLSANNKLGAQYKVPRLCNDRIIAEEILKYEETISFQQNI